MQLESDKINIGKKYKVKTNNSKKIKARVVSVNDSSIFLQKGKVKKIVLLSEIKQIRKRKFSYLKTAAIPITIAVFFAYGISNSLDLNIGEIQAPN